MVVVPICIERMTVEANRLRLRVGDLASIESRVVGAGIDDGRHSKSRSAPRRAAEVHAGLVANPRLAAPVPHGGTENIRGSALVPLAGPGRVVTPGAGHAAVNSGSSRQPSKAGDAAGDTSRRGGGAPCAGRVRTQPPRRRPQRRPRGGGAPPQPPPWRDALVGLDVLGPVGDGGAEGHARSGVDIDSHSRPQ